LALLENVISLEYTSDFFKAAMFLCVFMLGYDSDIKIEQG